MWRLGWKRAGLLILRGFSGRLLEWGAQALHRMHAEGSVRPQIGQRFGFEEIPAALQQLDGHQIRGKAIIEV